MTPLSFASLVRGPKVLAMMLTLLALACYGQTPGSSSWSAALNSPELFVKSESLEKNASQSILLIGENHAGIKTQNQLAQLLQALYKASEVDAILVEGSNGQIEAAGLRQTLDSMKAGDINEFWRGQLELGHIAGYEYVALTRKGVTAYGVEDMKAKVDFIAGLQHRGQEQEFQDLMDKHKRGLALARDAAVTLHSASINAELNAYQQQIDALVAVQAKVKEFFETEGTYNDLARRLVPARKILVGKAEPTDADYEAAYRSAGYSNASDFAHDLQRVSEARAWLKANQADVSALLDSFATRDRELEDQFFIVTNAIRSESGNKPTQALQTFIRDEGERARIEAERDMDAHEGERNHYMVSNTLQYLSQNPTIQRVVLIVGYAHVKDLTNLFGQENVNLLVGQISSANDEIEEWEENAWEARSVEAERIFSSASIKDKSRLQDPVFRQEIPVVVSKLGVAKRNAVSYEDARVFETHAGRANTKSIVLTSDVASLYANWGPYVVGSGKLPDKSNQYYQIFDRKRVLEAARRATSRTAWFAPAYATHTHDGRPVTNIDLPTGSVALGRFIAQAPNKGGEVPNRIVLAAEGTTKSIQTALGGNGSEPPRWTSFAGRMAEPPERRGPHVLFTKNIDRGQKNIHAVEQQDPLKAGEITSFEVGVSGEPESDLGNAWFTPTRGDHARLLLIVGNNTPEFRKQVREAAKKGLLKNKQIALVTCFDPKETDELREVLLAAGVLMVWTPESHISPEGARKFRDYAEKVDASSTTSPLKGLDDYIDRVLELWYREAPNDSDLARLANSSRWVKLLNHGSKVPDFPGKHLQEEQVGEYGL